MAQERHIAAMQVGERVEGFFILRSAAGKVTSTGKPYLSGTLSDNTGSIEFVAWDYAGPIGSGQEGSIVKMRGDVSEYRGKKQCTVLQMRLATDADEFDRSAVIPSAPVSSSDRMQEVKTLISGMEDEDYKKIAEAMLARHAEELERFPAAKNVHHDGVGGLLMHTGNMLRIADFLSEQYADTVDRSLLLTGTLLHDIAKTKEFLLSPSGLVTDYSLEGMLVGHLVLGAQEVAELAAALGVPEEKSVLLQHLILSHHGEPEFGAAVRPAVAEAELLSLIDLIDSRMEIYRKTFLEVPEGKFSGRVYALDKKIYRHS